MPITWKKAVVALCVILVSLATLLSVFLLGFDRGANDARNTIVIYQQVGNAVRAGIFIGFTDDLSRMTADSTQLIIAHSIWEEDLINSITVTAGQGLLSLNGGNPRREVTIRSDRRYIDTITYHLPQQGRRPFGNDLLTVTFFRQDTVMFTEYVDAQWVRLV